MDEDNQKKEIEEAEKNISASEQRIRFQQESEPATEKKEISPEEKIIADELKREIEMMELEPELKEEAEKKAKKIEFLGEADKIEHILAAAREKGPVFAVKIAKQTNDPFLLDKVHDILAKEGHYKNFIK